MRNQKGVTLAELLVTLVVLSILSLIAVSALGGHASRAKVADAFSAAEPLKKAVEDYTTAQGSFPENLAAIGVATTDVVGRYSAMMAGTDFSKGAFALTMTGTGDTALDGKKIRFTPAKAANGSMIWICGTTLTWPAAFVGPTGSTAPSTDLPAAFLPQGCR